MNALSTEPCFPIAGAVTCSSRTSASRHTSFVSITQALPFRSLGVHVARLLATRADLKLSVSVDLVPAFKSHESRGSGVDEALVVWSLGGE